MKPRTFTRWVKPYSFMDDVAAALQTKDLPTPAPRPAPPPPPAPVRRRKRKGGKDLKDPKPGRHPPPLLYSPLVNLRLPHPLQESQWYKGLMPWLMDFGPEVRGYMFLIACAWEPVGHWNRKEWMHPSPRIIRGTVANGLYTPIHPSHPEVTRMWRIALDVPFEAVGVFALTSRYARDKLLRLLVNIRQLRPEHRLPFTEELFRNSLPRPEQLRPRKLSLNPPRVGDGNW